MLSLLTTHRIHHPQNKYTNTPEAGAHTEIHALPHTHLHINIDTRTHIRRRRHAHAIYNYWHDKIQTPLGSMYRTKKR